MDYKTVCQELDNLVKIYGGSYELYNEMWADKIDTITFTLRGKNKKWTTKFLQSFEEAIEIAKVKLPKWSE
jgi:hypothetical protein